MRNVLKIGNDVKNRNMTYNPLKMRKKHLKQVITGKKASIAYHFVEKKAENRVKKGCEYFKNNVYWKRV